jgi:hypothetical protein
LRARLRATNAGGPKLRMLCYQRRKAKKRMLCYQRRRAKIDLLNAGLRGGGRLTLPFLLLLRLRLKCAAAVWPQFIS